MNKFQKNLFRCYSERLFYSLFTLSISIFSMNFVFINHFPFIKNYPKYSRRNVRIELTDILYLTIYAFPKHLSEQSPFLLAGANIKLFFIPTIKKYYIFFIFLTLNESKLITLFGRVKIMLITYPKKTF
jgi:hypothetical protein